MNSIFKNIPDINTFETTINNMELTSELSKQIFEFCLSNNLGYYFESVKEKMFPFQINQVINDIYFIDYLVEFQTYDLELNYKNIKDFSFSTLEYILKNCYYKKINLFNFDNCIDYYNFLSTNTKLFDLISKYIDCKYIVFYDYVFAWDYYNKLCKKISKQDLTEILQLTKNKKYIKPNIEMILKFDKELFDFNMFITIKNLYFCYSKMSSVFIKFINFLETQKFLSNFTDYQMKTFLYEVIEKNLGAFDILVKKYNSFIDEPHKILQIILSNDVKLLEKYILSNQITHVQEILFLAITKNKNKIVKFILKNFYDYIDIKKTISFVNGEFNIEILIDETQIKIIYFENNKKNINNKSKDFIRKNIMK